MAEMLEKHSQSEPSTIPSSSVPTPIKISEAVVVNFQNCSAPGPSGVRASHIKEAMSFPAPRPCQSCSPGPVRSCKPSFCWSSHTWHDPSLMWCYIFASKKKGGDLHPIAVRLVLRRLTSRCISRVVMGEAFKALTLLQVGVGVPVGCVCDEST